MALLQDIEMDELVLMNIEEIRGDATACDITKQCPIVLLESMDCLTHLSPPAQQSITKWQKKVLDPSIRELVSRKCCSQHCLAAFDSATITLLRDRYYSLSEANSRAWLCGMRESMYDNSYVLSGRVLQYSCHCYM